MSVLRRELTIGGRALSISNTDKVLYPRDGYTKGDLIAYYTANAQLILPHLRDRPLTLERYPNGIDASSFFEKHVPKGTPEWVSRATIAHADERRASTTYVVCNDVATLALIANLASIILHVWTSRTASINEPDYVFFDLDPGEQCMLKTLVRVALDLRDVLGSIGITSLVKTSGGFGLHVVVPLVAGYGYDDVKLFAEIIARHLAQHDPTQVTLERSLAKRDPKSVYLDYQQVGRGKTMVSAYSVRARDGAPVSTPLQWSEVEAFARKRTAALPADVFAAFNLRSIPARTERFGDLWAGSAWKKQHLEATLAKARRSWGRI